MKRYPSSENFSGANQPVLYRKVANKQFKKLTDESEALAKLGSVSSPTDHTSIVERNSKFVGFEGINPIISVFTELLAKQNVSLTDVRGLNGAICYYLTQSNAYRGYIPANEVGLYLLHAASIEALLDQTTSDGRTFLEVLQAKTAYITDDDDDEGKHEVSMAQAISVFENATDANIKQLKNYMSRLKKLIATPSDKGLPASLTPLKAGEDWEKADISQISYLVCESAYTIFGQYKPNEFIFPAAFLINALVNVQKEQVTSLTTGRGVSIFFDAKVKSMFEFPKILTASDLFDETGKLSDFVKCVMYDELASEIRQFDSTITSLLGTPGKGVTDKVSLYTLDTDKYALSFVNAVREIEDKIIDKMTCYAQFLAEQKNAKEWLKIAYLYQGLKQPSSNPLLKLSENELRAARLLILKHLDDGDDEFCSISGFTQTKADEYTCTVKRFREYLDMFMSYYDEVLFDDIRAGYTFYTSGDLKSPMILGVRRDVFREREFFIAQPTLSDNPARGDHSAKGVRITSCPVSRHSPYEFNKDVGGTKANMYLDKQTMFGSEFKSGKVKYCGDDWLLYETLDAERTLISLTVNVGAYAVTASKSLLKVYKICPCMTIRSFGQTVDHKYALQIGSYNANTGKVTTTTVEPIAKKKDDISVYLALFIDGDHYLSDIKFDESARLNPHTLNQLYTQTLQRACENSVTETIVSEGFGTSLSSEVMADVPLEGEGASYEAVTKAFLNGINEIQFIASKDRDPIMAKLYSMKHTCFVASPLAKLVTKKSRERYSDLVLNGVNFKTAEKTFTLRLPLSKLPEKTKQIVINKGSYDEYFYSRKIIDIRYAKDDSGKIVHSDLFGDLVDVSWTVHWHDDPSKMNLKFPSFPAQSAFFKAKDTHYFVPFYYGIPKLDQSTSRGSSQPLLKEASIFSDREAAIHRPMSVLFDNDGAIDIREMVLSPTMVDCIRWRNDNMVYPEGETMDVVDYDAILFTRYVGRLISGLYLMVCTGLFSSLIEQEDFVALSLNIEEYLTYMKGEFADDVDLSRFGVIKPAGTNLAMVEKLIRALSGMNASNCQTYAPTIKALAAIFCPDDLATAAAMAAENAELMLPVVCTESDKISPALGMIGFLSSKPKVYYEKPIICVSGITEDGMYAVGPAIYGLFNAFITSWYNNRLARSFYAISAAEAFSEGVVSDDEDGADAFNNLKIVSSKGATFMYLNTTAVADVAVLKDETPTELKKLTPGAKLDLNSELSYIVGLVTGGKIVGSKVSFTDGEWKVDSSFSSPVDVSELIKAASKSNAEGEETSGDVDDEEGDDE